LSKKTLFFSFFSVQPVPVPAKRNSQQCGFSRCHSKIANKTPETDFGVKNAVGKKFGFSRLNPTILKKTEGKAEEKNLGSAG